MEGGLPMLNCLLQHTLRSLCSSSSASSEPCRWVYAVFWRILPRKFPPPKWEFGGGALDRAKGNKRNWILVWEDGYCNFLECERATAGEYVKGRFGADVYFKMSHEVYNYGEGLVGKVAAENSHRWVFKAREKDEPSCFSSWNVSIDTQPKAWENQFNSGIQTIALISVREGIVQLGSFDKVPEDLNLVINTQRKFSYLQSIPGNLTIQRPNTGTLNLNPANPYTIEANVSSFFATDKHQLVGSKRVCSEGGLTETPIKSINLGWKAPQSGLTGPPMWSLPPLLPALPYNFGLFLSRPPYAAPPFDPTIGSEIDLIDNSMHGSRQRPSPGDSGHGAHPAHGVKAEPECVQEDNSCCLNTNYGSNDNGVAGESRFGTLKGRDPVL